MAPPCPWADAAGAVLHRKAATKEQPWLAWRNSGSSCSLVGFFDAVFMLTSCANRALVPGSCTLSPEGLPGPVLHKTRGGASRKTGAVALRHHHKGGSRHAGCDP